MEAECQTALGGVDAVGHQRVTVRGAQALSQSLDEPDS
jgi:hypothetical protein